jgi:hypothetical protein
MNYSLRHRPAPNFSSAGCSGRWTSTEVRHSMQSPTACNYFEKYVEFVNNSLPKNNYCFCQYILKNHSIQYFFTQCPEQTVFETSPESSDHPVESQPMKEVPSQSADLFP